MPASQADKGRAVVKRPIEVKLQDPSCSFLRKVRQRGTVIDFIDPHRQATFEDQLIDRKVAYAVRVLNFLDRFPSKGNT